MYLEGIYIDMCTAALNLIMMVQEAMLRSHWFSRSSQEQKPKDTGHKAINRGGKTRLIEINGNQIARVDKEPGDSGCLTARASARSLGGVSETNELRWSSWLG